MSEVLYSALAHLEPGQVGVQLTLDGQDILVRHGDIRLCLACLLTFSKARIVRRGENLYWRILHDRQADELIVEFIDLFISICYAHPTLVQLELEIDCLRGR